MGEIQGMKLSALLQPLIDAKADHSLIMRQILAFEAEQVDALEKRREADRVRQSKKRERDELSRDVTLRHSDRLLTGAGDVPVEDKLLPKEIEPQKEQEEKKGAQARDVSDFRAEFPDLDTPRLEALIKHRRSKRAQITGHAARLFRSAAAECGLSLSQAVDTCIDRNWITLKPDWLNKPQARGSPPRGVDDLISSLLSDMDTADANATTQTEGYPAAPLRISRQLSG